MCSHMSKYHKFKFKFIVDWYHQCKHNCLLYEFLSGKKKERKKIFKIFKLFLFFNIEIKTASTYSSGKVTSTEYDCATGTNGTCAPNIGTMAMVGIVYSCCSTDKCNVGTADAYSTMKSPTTTFTTLVTLFLVAIVRK